MITVRAINTWISMLDLCSFVQVDSLRLAFWCQKMLEWTIIMNCILRLLFYCTLLSASVG